MEESKVKDVAHEIFEMSEKTIYNITDKFNNNQAIDETLTFVYVKAFYIHSVRLYLNLNNKLEGYDDLYKFYKEEVINYYKQHNKGITQALLKDIEDAFENSYQFIESLGFYKFDFGYEYRHHIIDTFELLKQILEKKSKTNIRNDIFENNISEIKNQSEEIIDYIRENL